MLSHNVTTALAELANDPDAERKRACLDRVSTALIRSPEEGAGLVRELGTVAVEADGEDHLHEILSAALDFARMAREKDQARGGILIGTLGDTVEQLAADGHLTIAGSLALSRAWVRAGLTPPAALVWSDGFPGEPAMEHGGVDASQLEPMIDDIFGDLIGQAAGDVSVVHGALSEMFPTLPTEMRDALIRATLTQPDAIFGRLGCAFLIDPAPDIRLAAAQGLAARLAAGRLEAEVAAHLVILRSWLPDDAARASLDMLLQGAMRRGVSGGALAQPWKIHKVLATMPDGTGSQSLGVSVQRGSQRALAMVLLKQDFGVKDAFMIPCASATEQRTILASLESETGALITSPEYLTGALELALADGLAHGLPPAAGLIEIAEACGLVGLRPQGLTTDALLSALDPQDSLSALSPQARGRLINASEFWPDDHDLLSSWFEDSDACRAVLDVPRAPRSLETALWTWLETRRAWWARIMARSAQLLLATGHSDARSFLATARSLLEGRPLRKIPIMADILDQTIAAWLHGDDGDMHEADPDLLMLDDPDDLPPMPAPEKKGELAKLLKGGSTSPNWIDGYLTAICVAPKEIPPDRWIQPLLHAALPTLNERNLQRFIDIVMYRYNAAVDRLQNPRASEDALGALGNPGLCDWCDGFLIGKHSFKPSWPTKALGPNDKAILRTIEGMAADPVTGVSAIPVLAAWLTARFEAVAG